MSIGLVVRRGERTWRLERHLEDGTLIFSDQIDGRPLTMTVAGLWRDLGAKRLCIVGGEAPVSQAIGDTHLVFDWNSLAPKLRAIAEWKLRYVDLVRRRGLTRGMRQAIGVAVAEVAEKNNDANPPSASSVMRWVRDLDAANGAPMALVAKQLCRTRKSTKSDFVLQLAREELRTYYCSSKRPSLQKTKSQIDRVLASKVLQQKLTPEEATISHSTVRRLRDEIDPYARDQARYGASYARNKWRYSLKGSGTTRAMQRYEIDHTVVDMVVICDRTGLPLGRPTITVVVDNFSGYVVGFYVSFWGTGLATTLSALKVALSPKDLYTEGSDLTNRWQGMGLPELIVVDNGLEFHSQQFWSVVAHLSIDLLYCAMRQPWLKPVVERTLGAYLNYLPPEGKVRKTLSNEVPTSPKQTAAITFSSFCEGLLKTFVDVHPFEINQRKLSRPYDLFLDSLAELPPPALPISTDEIEIIVAPSKTMTVGNEGVVSDYLRYNSPELQSMRRSIGERFTSTVKFDPENLGSIYVQDPRSQGWLPVPSNCPEYSDGLSLIQHRAIRTHAKQHLSRIHAEETLMRAKSELVDMWQSSAVVGRKLQANHVRALANLTSSQALKSHATPISKTTAPEAPPRLVCAKELHQEVREIPDFDCFEL